MQYNLIFSCFYNSISTTTCLNVFQIFYLIVSANSQPPVSSALSFKDYQTTELSGARESAPPTQKAPRQLWSLGCRWLWHRQDSPSTAFNIRFIIYLNRVSAFLTDIKKSILTNSVSRRDASWIIFKWLFTSNNSSLLYIILTMKNIL